MKNLETISEELFNKIRGRHPAITIGDQEGKVTSEPKQARFFDFEYKTGDRKLGRVSVSLDEDNLSVMYTNNFVKEEDDTTRQDWYNFLRELRNFAKKRLLDFDVRDITKSNLDRRDYKFLAQQKGGNIKMSESTMYGTNNISYQKIGNARLNIRHRKPVNTEQAGARTRSIDKIYIESQEGERFKYPYRHLAGARAMARHVSEGGNPYDDFGKHVVGLSEELNNLKKFKTYVGRSRVMAEGLSQYMDIIEGRAKDVKKELQNIQKANRYADVLETYENIVLEEVPENVKTNWIDELTIRQFNEELKDVFPYIYRLIGEGRKTQELGPEEIAEESEDDEDGFATKLKTRGSQNPQAAKLDADVRSGNAKKNFDPEEIEKLEDLKQEMMAAYPNSPRHYLTFREKFATLKVSEPNRADRFKSNARQFDELIKSLGGSKKITSGGDFIFRLPKGFSSETSESADEFENEVDEAHGNSKIYDKCWDGYEKVPGKKRGEKGSCRKKEDSDDQETEQLPITEFILSHYDQETGSWPRGETAVLTGVEKDYGEQYIETAKQFIDKINETYQQYLEACDCEKHKDDDEEETVQETDAESTSIEVAPRDALIANEIGKDLFRGDYENDGSTVFQFDDEERAQDFESELRKQGVQIVNTQDEEFERLKHLAGV